MNCSKEKISNNGNTKSRSSPDTALISNSPLNSYSPTTSLPYSLKQNMEIQTDPNIANVEFRCPAPFSTDPAAVQALNDCDYSIRITDDLAKSGLAPRAVRVYADGVYDMFHSGHARQLMQARMAFPNTYLIVGVTSDEITLKCKGSTVMNETERYEAVRHCRYVDEVIKVSHWEYGMDFVTKHKIDFVAHDDIPYATSQSGDMYQCFKEKGMFLTTQRTECISTTDVIGRILRDYDLYLRRNISRGLSRKDLNISYVKEKQLQIGENIHTMVQKGTHLLNNFGSRRRQIVGQLEELYQDMSKSFVRFFGSRGSLRGWWNGCANVFKVAVSPATSDEDEDADQEDRLRWSRRPRLLRNEPWESTQSASDSEHIPFLGSRKRYTTQYSRSGLGDGSQPKLRRTK